MGKTKTKMFAKKCPALTATFAPKDEGTLWMVAYSDGKHEGELAITIGADAEANAKLYAAAPDLAEALRECITEGDATCFAHDGRMRPNAVLMRRRMLAINDIARAALAKAGL